jgi:glutathione S-transferase
MFAALNTVEPPILELATAKLLEGDKPWSKAPPLVEDRVRDRLDQLSGGWAMPTGSMVHSARAT